MSIFSTNLLYSSDYFNFGFWQKITTLSFVNSSYHNLEYNTFYKCYTMYSYGCKFCYSFDLVNWQEISDWLIYNPINKHYYKLDNQQVGDNYVLSISEMTSLNVFENSKILDTIDYNTNSYGVVYNLVKLGNYYAFVYSCYNRIGYGTSSQYNSFQKLFYTQDFNTWQVNEFYAKSLTGKNYTQITSLGSSGTKYVLFSSTEDGYRPVVFTTPTNHTFQDVLWTAGNMTAATGFYCNGVWHYCNSQGLVSLLSENGTTFTKCTDGYWRNPYMLFYKNHYITANSSTNQIRVYDSTFTNYSEISPPRDKMGRILGILDENIYIIDGYKNIFRTKITNLIT